MSSVAGTRGILLILQRNFGTSAFSGAEGDNHDGQVKTGS